MENKNSGSQLSGMWPKIWLNELIWGVGLRRRVQKIVPTNEEIIDRPLKFLGIPRASALKRGILILLVSCALITGAIAEPAVTQQTGAAPEYRKQDMKIRIIFDGITVTGTLADNPTARDFASLLPLRLTLTDYASTEKISDLPRKLSRLDAPDGINPVIGDITYYAPWGNLAIFHKNFRYSPNLIRIGVIDYGTDVFSKTGSMRVRIERMDN